MGFEIFVLSTVVNEYAIFIMTDVVTFTMALSQPHERGNG